MGYYAGWAAYQGFTPDQIPAEHLTQINYAFAQIDPDTLTIALENPAHDQKNLAALRKLRQQNQHLKLLISVGGWSDSQYFSDAAAPAARRESFAASCVDFVVEQGLDGVDLDWEYPVSGGAAGTIHRPADKQNFTLLLQELREQLDRQGRRDGKDYALTIAGAAGSWYLNQIEAVKVAAIVDHIFVMGYDLEGRQHPQGVRLVHRLAETLVIKKHHGVGSDDDFLRCAEGGGRVGLLPGDVLHRLPGGEAGGIGLLCLRHPDVKVRDADALEQLLPPGRAGGQYDLCHGRALTFRWSRSRPGRDRPDAPLW